MGRLIDEDILIDSIPDLSAFEQEDFGTPDMIRLIEDAPTVQAIPKADYEARLKENNKLVNDLEELRTMINKFAESYENRLKADMVAMLEVIKLRIDSLPEPLNRDRVNYCIQEKINVLKENK